MSLSSKSILIIGATGPSGEQVTKKLLAHPVRSGNPSKVQVHIFCRNPSKVSEANAKAVASIQQGDARNVDDLSKALSKTKPTHVVVCIGAGNNLGKTDIRTASAAALTQALENTPGMKNVQVVVLSSSGAGTSRIKVGLGIGAMIEFHLRHVLADHTGQEAVFLENDGLADRTWIVRPTGLTDNKPHDGKVVTFGDLDKGPTVHIDREDVASYIADGIYEGNTGGRIENITTAK
jgi:uncharacterized protein YbjT (DUF2867 family)